MGKTPEKLRLVIQVDADWFTHPQVEELKEKGHQVYVVGTKEFMPSPPHLILSRAAHAWDDKMWDLLDLPLKAARERKKGLASDNQD